VLQDELAGKTTSLTEQGAVAGTREKKEGLPPRERRDGQLKRSTGVSLGRAERKLERQKPS